MAGYANGGMVRPVKGGRVTSGFGAGRGRYPHAGIDLAVPIGTPVFAAMDGTVLSFQPPGRTGRYVFLSHPGGRNTYYGHLSDRKSTRLNSSHVSISYAVFCLKKKITVTYQ